MSNFQYRPSDAKPWPKGFYRGELVEVRVQEPDRVQLFWDVKNPVTNATKRTCDTIAASTAAWKLKQLCYALSLHQEFESGIFDPYAHLEIGTGLWLDLKPSTQPGLMSIGKYSRYKPVNRTAREPLVSASDNDLMNDH